MKKQSKNSKTSEFNPNSPIYTFVVNPIPKLKVWLAVIIVESEDMLRHFTNCKNPAALFVETNGFSCGSDVDDDIYGVIFLSKTALCRKYLVHEIVHAGCHFMRKFGDKTKLHKMYNRTLKEDREEEKLAYFVQDVLESVEKEMDVAGFKLEP